MRTEKVEGNQIVIRDGGACVKYDLALIEKQISKLESQLETWREYKRLLTPVAADVAYQPPKEPVTASLVIPFSELVRKPRR